MLKFISLLLWGEDTPISLDEAYNILEDTQEETEEKNIPLEDENQFDEDYVALRKNGVVSEVNDGLITIDNLYKFYSSSPYFMKGVNVSYNLILSKEGHKVTDLSVLEHTENNWDIIESKMSKWCLRTIVCKVQEKMGRKIILEPGKIEIDLNEVTSEFVPITGDWVQLDAKCEIDEHVVDLHGNILEVVKILPLRPHIKLCTVTSWDSEEFEGTLNNFTYFNKDSLSGGYTPVKNDQVVAEIIESNQGRCSTRALKVLPDFIKPKLDDMENILELNTELKIDGILINKPECLMFEKLKETSSFLVIVNNQLNENVIVCKIEFPKLNSQCKVLSNSQNISLIPKDTYEVQCECTSAHMGKSREYLLITTDKGKIGVWIDLLVTSVSAKSYGYYEKGNSSYKFREKNDIIKGQKVSVSPRFIAVHCQNYKLPKRLLDVVTKYQNTFVEAALLKEELISMKPHLNANLTFNNFLDRFHTLLYLEEIENVISMSNYDQKNAIFIRNNEFLMWEIENLSERRPSIIVGDRVYAVDSYGLNKTNWEGFVHKVGAKHVYIKFSTMFHNTYNGEDYDIHVEGSRTAIRRLHQAVDLAMKNLGCDILFPSKVIMKQPQTNFKCTGINKSTTPNRKEILKKMIEYKMKSDIEKENYKRQVLDNSLDQENVLQLEWYNKSLNHYQKEAVKNVLYGRARPLPYIIFGPPGTGKTVTLVECILQILRLIPSSRILIAAPSNSATDLIALRLIESGVLKPGDLVRYVSYNYVSNLPTALAPFSATGNLSREGTNARGPTILDNGLTLGSTIRVLGRHRITVTTCSSAGALYTMGFPKGHFSHILVDEAGQAMEPEVLIPLVFLDKSSGQAVLAGDPQQLGPVIMSQVAIDFGLQESYVERLLNRFPYTRDPDGFPETGGYDPRLVTKLLCNYRTLPSLLKLTSFLFYNDDLIPMLSDMESSREEVMLLEKLDEILLRSKETGKLPNIVFHGINGENFQTPDSPSWFNPSEASQVFFYINELYRLGLKPADIGVISPYVKQVKEIKAILNEAEFELPRIGSVEEFQGQEFNVVILSTVRSNVDYVTFDIKHSLGFISSPRRLNVAISRARVLLIIIGNPNLLYGDKYWQSIINYAIKKGNFVGCNINVKD